MTNIILQDIQKFGATLADFTSLTIAKVHLTRYVDNVYSMELTTDIAIVIQINFICSFQTH